MRTVLILLLLANLTLFGYTWLDGGGGGEAVRLAEQVQPDKIRLLTPQEVAQLGPAKVAALADVCVEWGPFADSERARALSELDPLAVGKLTSQKRVDTTGVWSAMLAPFANRPAADRRAGELRALNVRDVAVVDTGAGRYTVAIGTFRNEDAAKAHAADLTRQGVIGTAVAAPRPQAVPMTLVIIRDPPAAVVARLRELQAAYPAAEIKVGSCDRA
ncbi:MAG: SPOR domain-containing protein [Betaproteobacteria bacterium]